MWGFLSFIIITIIYFLPRELVLFILFIIYFMATVIIIVITIIIIDFIRIIIGGVIEINPFKIIISLFTFIINL